MNKALARAKRERSLAYKERQHETIIKQKWGKRSSEVKVTPHFLERLHERDVPLTAAMYSTVAVSPEKSKPNVYKYTWNGVTVIAKKVKSKLILITTWGRSSAKPNKRKV